MFRQVRILSRRFSTVNHYFEEHYQYPGNPTNEEFTKYFNENRKTYVQETTIYKPKDQIEFDRTGELVLYECDVYQTKPIYFHFPTCLPMIAVPFNLYMYLENPFGLL